MAADYFALNKNCLDEEWENQPLLFREVARQLADAREQHEIAMAATKVAYAEVSLAVRADPHKYGFEEKLTEDAVKSTILVSDKYKKAVALEIAAGHLVDCLKADVDTLDHRKKALEKLVDLRLSEYWAEPRLPRRVERVMNKDAKLFKKKPPQALAEG